jgi:hypothetical protein
MITSLEKDLRKHISEKRKLEMEKYGRTKSYNQILEFLQKDTQTLFSLINHAPTIIDDKIDADGNKERLNRATFILNQGFQGRKILLRQNWERDVFKLGRTLLKLHKNNYNNAINILNEVIKYWKIEKQNFSRKNKILNSRDLDKLNLEIGKSVGIQFLYIICPKLDVKNREIIASLYGLAIKIADNLSDIDEDLKRGYINISKENIKKYKIKLTNLSEKELQPYAKKEFNRVREYYKKSDIIVEKILKQYPFQKKGILLFQNIAYSWFKQVSEVAFIQELKQFDIANYSLPKFLPERKILEMEKFYGISLSDITTLSYKQETRNTCIIRKKNLSYSRYSLGKTPQANEKIKKIISQYPKIKDVLDLGCDDGSRTVELFKGRKSYGIEIIEPAAESARKKGITVYVGSMVKDVYRDSRNPKGKQFDLVSLLGEMVNFIGLGTDDLLINSIKQLKNNGYFLVSCMHTKFDKTQEENYVVWSFTKFTKNKWFLKERKIPRTFFLLSRQGLLKKIKKIAQDQNCHLILKNEEIVENYYEDMSLGIYIFQKRLD